MGKPSCLSKQGNQLTPTTASRDNHAIPSALDCSHGTLFIFHYHFSERNLSSEGGRANQESDFTAVMQNLYMRGDGDVLRHVLRGRREAHWMHIVLVKAPEHVSPRWALIWCPGVSRLSLVMAKLGKVHNTSAGAAHLPLGITERRLLSLQRAFWFCFWVCVNVCLH